MKSCRRNTSEVIPTDLIIEILSRLPAKSIARCRCVSKPWASMLGRPDFTNYFLAKSCGRPQIFFKCHSQGKFFFFSTPQDDNSSPGTATYHMKFVSDAPTESCVSVGGLVCHTHLGGLVCHTHLGILKRRNKKFVPVICNPSTGQTLTLPIMKTNNVCFFGYDPIDNEYKVLSLPSGVYGAKRISEEHQVLTLGARKPCWRTVDCCTPHYPLKSIISACINGVLYYLASSKSSRITSIVSFDVRSEKFRFINRDEDMTSLTRSTLANYKGKLASLSSNDSNFLRVTGETKSFEMWVLEDEEKHVWSKNVFELPPMWPKNKAEEIIYFVGVTGTDEIVLSPEFLFDPFFVFYYNLDSKTIRRVEIQGMGAFEDYEVYTSVNHVEDVKLIETFRTYNLRSRNKS